MTTPAAASDRFRPIPNWWALLLLFMAGAAYWIAFSTTRGAPAVLVGICCVCLVARLRSSGLALVVGAAAGLAMYVPHLWFFSSIFGWLAIGLWEMAALPIAMFVFLLHAAHKRLGSTWALALTPMLWTGVEYFRSELYYLRFAWLLPGQAAAFLPGVRLASMGVYGLGFIMAAIAALAADQRWRVRLTGAGLMIVLTVLMYFPALPRDFTQSPLHVAGVQLEFADEPIVTAALEKLAIAHPEAQILVLSEYTFQGPVPQMVREVVKRHHRYLVAGGIKQLTALKFYDTTFVVGPDGRDVFAQGKSVPVQFMDDGLPAPQRRVWDSPWGKIGLAVCYDLSYSRVMDDFVRQGAQGLIIPTMDVAKWGEYERRMLHGRMAPIRSAEYGIPTFGVWSSGVSQLTDRFGNVITTAGYAGQGEMIAGPFPLGNAGHIPPDRWLAMAATAGTALLAVYLSVQWLKDRAKAKVDRGG